VFGSGKRIAQLEASNTKLQQELTELKGLDAVQREERLEACRRDLETATGELAEARAQYEAVKSEAKAARDEIVETQELALLQEVGIYEYRHPLAGAPRARLTQSSAG
jgi:predicted  nucleic acid-binding Zn-ribbon protein